MKAENTTNRPARINRRRFNGAKGVVTNHPEANALLKKNYRPGWTLNG